MKSTDLLRQITSLHKGIEKRLKQSTDEQLSGWLQGYLTGLDDVTALIKRELELERAEQKLARIKNDLAQEPEPDWSRVPESVAKGLQSAANSNAEEEAVAALDADRKAA